METKDKDMLSLLFDAMPGENLPADFNEKVMLGIRKVIALREKKRRFWELCGYAAGFAAMLITCVITVYSYDISFHLPDITALARLFPKPDFDMFRSTSFRFSMQIGIVALTLLVIDSTIRRYIAKKRE